MHSATWNACAYQHHCNIALIPTKLLPSHKHNIKRPNWIWRMLFSTATSLQISFQQVLSGYWKRRIAVALVPCHHCFQFSYVVASSFLSSLSDGLYRFFDNSKNRWFNFCFLFCSWISCRCLISSICSKSGGPRQVFPTAKCSPLVVYLFVSIAACAVCFLFLTCSAASLPFRTSSLFMYSTIWFVRVPESPSCRLSWSGVIEVLLMCEIQFNGTTPNFVSCISGFNKQL